jgi:hypothetical protein
MHRVEMMVPRDRRRVEGRDRSNGNCQSFSFESVHLPSPNSSFEEERIPGVVEVV